MGPCVLGADVLGSPRLVGTFLDMAVLLGGVDDGVLNVLQVTMDEADFRRRASELELRLAKPDVKQVRPFVLCISLPSLPPPVCVPGKCSLPA